MHRDPQEPTVWVLSEESPFDDPEASGGCVSGVFATAVAALYYLATTEIGEEGLANITWTPIGRGYEGIGHRETIYILRPYPVETEPQLRQAQARLVAQYDCVPDPASLSTLALWGCLPPHEEDAADEP